MAQEPVHYQADGGGEGRPAAERSVPRWWRGPDPDPVEVGRLYVQENHTETEIAVMLSVSRARVTAILLEAGIPRRDPRKNCPVDPDTLRPLVRAGATATSVAREHGVSIRRRRGGWPKPACSVPTRKPTPASSSSCMCTGGSPLGRSPRSWASVRDG